MGWQLKFELLYFCLQGSSTIPENLSGRFSFIYLFGNLYWNLFHCISIMKYLITAVLVHKFSLLHLVSSLQTQVTGLPTGCWGLSLSLSVFPTLEIHTNFQNILIYDLTTLESYITVVLNCGPFTGSQGRKINLKYKAM